MGPIIDNKFKQPQQNPQQRRGTGFTNLNKILNAQQGSKVGSAVSGGISNVAQQARAGTESAKQEFGQKAEQSRVSSSQQGQEKSQGFVSRFGVPAQPATQQPGQPSQPNNDQREVVANDRLNNMNRDVGTRSDALAEQRRITAGLGPIQEAAVYEGDFQALTDEEIADYQKLTAGTYAGPRDLQNQEQLLAKAQRAETLGGLTQSSGGREELLRQFVGGGQGYTSGMSKLDQLILGKQGNLTGARRETRGQMQDVSQAAQSARNLASQIEGQEKAASEKLKADIAGIGTTISGDIENRFKSAEQFEQNRAKIATELQNFKGNSDQLGQFLFDKGLIGPQQLEQINAIDKANKIAAGLAEHEHGLKDKNKYTESYYKDKLNEFITQGSSASQNLSQAGVTSAEQAARLQALQQLGAGQFQQYLGDDINKVGSFQAGKVGISDKSLNSYLQGLSKDLYKAELDRINDQMDKGEFARKESSRQITPGITSYSFIDSGKEDIYADYRNQLKPFDEYGDLSSLVNLISGSRASTKKQLEDNLKRLQEQGYDVNQERYYDFYKN
jgi:hypothetical protein